MSEIAIDTLELCLKDANVLALYAITTVEQLLGVTLGFTDTKLFSLLSEPELLRIKVNQLKTEDEIMRYTHPIALPAMGYRKKKSQIFNHGAMHEKQ